MLPRTLYRWATAQFYFPTQLKLINLSEPKQCNGAGKGHLDPGLSRIQLETNPAPSLGEDLCFLIFNCFYIREAATAPHRAIKTLRKAHCDWQLNPRKNVSSTSTSLAAHYPWRSNLTTRRCPPMLVWGLICSLGHW